MRAFKAQTNLLAGEVCRNGNFFLICEGEVFFDSMTFTENVPGNGHGFPAGQRALFFPEVIGRRQLEVPRAIQ